MSETSEPRNDGADHAAETPAGRALVRRAGEVTPVEVDPAHGNVRYRTLFDSRDTGTGTLSAGVAELDPGGWMAVHRHPQPEMYYVLEGYGRLEVDGAAEELEPGCSAHIPGDAVHGIRSVGESPLRLLYTFAADSLADVDYQWL